MLKQVTQWIYFNQNSIILGAKWVHHVPTKFLIMFILDHIDPTPTILLVNLLDYNDSMMKRFSKICHSPKYLLYSLEHFLIQ